MQIDLRVNSSKDDYKLFPLKLILKRYHQLRPQACGKEKAWERGSAVVCCTIIAFTETVEYD